jgi:hypothetical protein
MHRMYLHESEGCPFTVPCLGPTGLHHFAVPRILQSSIPFTLSQPAEAPVGKHSGVKWVYLHDLHLQPTSMRSV